MPSLKSKPIGYKPIGYLTGLACPFYDGTPATEYGRDDDTKIRFVRGAFDGVSGADVRITVNADPSKLIGRTSNGSAQVWADAEGLRYSVDLPDTGPARDILANVRRGDLSGSGFSFRVTREDWTTEDGFTVRLIEAVDVLEVGPVTYPMFPGTTAEVKTSRSDSPRARRLREIEAWEFEIFDLKK